MTDYLGRRMFALFEQTLRVDASELQAHTDAPRIGRPALIVHDLEDREVPWSEGERYARFWAGLAPAEHARAWATTGSPTMQGVIAAALRFLHGETVGERVVSSPNLPYGFA